MGRRGRVREGWHGSCCVVYTETCTGAPGGIGSHGPDDGLAYPMSSRCERSNEGYLSQQRFCVSDRVVQKSADVLKVPLQRSPAYARQGMYGQADARALGRARTKEGEQTMAEVTNSLRQPRTMHPAAHAMPAEESVNVGDAERWLSLLGGGLLALYMLRRSLGTVVLLGGAGALLYRGLKGQCALYKALGISTAAHDPQSTSPRSVAAPDEQQRIVLSSS
jgi:DUF2892 family protein